MYIGVIKGEVPIRDDTGSTPTLEQMVILSRCLLIYKLIIEHGHLYICDILPQIRYVTDNVVLYIQSTAVNFYLSPFC